jgi:hypothetical protein
MGTGEAKEADCHPLLVSPENVTAARRAPLLLHRLPVCVPVLPVPL